MSDFDKGEARKYRTIVADPPWPMPKGGGQSRKSAFMPRETTLGALPYSAMELDEIAALPVSELAATGAHLYIWTVNTHLEFTYELARTWGFSPRCLLTWAKTPRGIGLGGAFTQTTEHVLFARRGKCKAKQRVDSTWWNWPRRRHSEKPEAFVDLVETVSPGPYVELFARRARFGWDYWGDESLGTADLGSAA